MNNKKLATAGIYMISILLLLQIVNANITITEILYDPIGTESGGEAVELYNPTDQPINISGWQLMTESSTHDATIPPGTLLGIGQYYLIADNNWNTKKDSENWVKADHEEAITMYNSNSGIALSDNMGNIIDAVGWGEVEGIKSGLYYGTPTNLDDEGKSLQRITNTNNNHIDFIYGLPDLKNSKTQEVNENIRIELEVENSPINITIETKETKILPIAGKMKTFEISGTIQDNNGIENKSLNAKLIGFEEDKIINIKIKKINSTKLEYKLNIEMNYYDLPGNYAVKIYNYDTLIAEQKFEYLQLMSIRIDTDSTFFQRTTAGKSNFLIGDFAMSTKDKPTIRNTGNVQLNIGLKGNDLISNNGKINVKNIMYSFGKSFKIKKSGVLSNSEQKNLFILEPGEESATPIGFKVTVPANTPVGNYSGSIKIIATS